MRSGEDFDIIIGFLGFWAVVLLVVTVWMEVTAQPALGWALGLLAHAAGAVRDDPAPPPAARKDRDASKSELTGESTGCRGETG